MAHASRNDALTCFVREFCDDAENFRRRQNFNI